jgi:glycine C-acetyltransferase
VPKGIIILRLIPTALHTDEDIQLTLAAFGTIADKLKAGKYQAEKEVLNPVLKPDHVD